MHTELLFMKKGKEIDSEIIIESIKNGKDDLVLKELYRHVLPVIKAHVKKNGGSNEDAEDVFQDAVITLYKQIKLNKYQEVGSGVGGFLFTVSKNLWYNKLKRNNKISLTDEHPNTESGDLSILEKIITEEKINTINQLLNEVGEQCKKILSLSIYDKIPMKEISKEMGFKSDDVAKSIHYRCKKKLGQLARKSKVYMSSLGVK